MSDVVNIVAKIFELGYKIKEAVDTVKVNEDLCVQIGKRVSTISDIVSRLDSTGDTKHPALNNPLSDLKETLEKAYKYVKECQNVKFLKKILHAKDLSNDLHQVNQEIMEHMKIADFANNVNSNENISLIANHIKSGVHVTLPKDAGKLESSHSHSLLQGAPIPPSCKRFTLAELEMATFLFSRDNSIGKGVFSLVYKGTLPGGTEVAIKRYSTPMTRSARQYIPDFQRLHHHENIVSILGYCIDTKMETISDELKHSSAEIRDSILVLEEYMPNGSLYNILQGRRRRDLDWPTAFRIIQGIARGMAFIHANCFIHLYCSMANILLDSHMNPKISGFGFSKRLEHVNQEVTQPMTEELANIIRLMPEKFEEDGNYIVSAKTDVHTFGLTLLYIIQRVSSSDRWKRLIEMVTEYGPVDLSDPSLSELCHPSCDPSDLKEIRRCYEIYLRCSVLPKDPTHIPTMLDVIEMLDAKMQVLPEGFWEDLPQ